MNPKTISRFTFLVAKVTKKSFHRALMGFHFFGSSGFKLALLTLEWLFYTMNHDMLLQISFVFGFVIAETTSIDR